MRDTPRTDVETYELDYKVLIPREGGEWVKADFARELEREVAALKAERDEARREVCEIMHYTGYLRGDYANHRKWDCYNDGKHHPFSKEIKQNFNAWMDGQYELHAKEIKRLEDERDEARRDACAFEAIVRWNEAHPKGIMSPCAVERISREIAVDRGWDCYKEGGGA